MTPDPCQLSYQIIVKNQFSNSDLIDKVQLVRARVKRGQFGVYNIFAEGMGAPT